MSLTRPLVRPLTSRLTRPITQAGAGGGFVSIVSNGVLAPFVTFTRASTATYFDSAGVMQTAAIDTPRVDYNPSTLELRGLLVERQATNLLLNSATLSTQSVTVTATAHTLSFYGTGTVTLSGSSTAGPLVGTGANNRVTLTFTPSAGSLTLTVSGSATLAQLEAGSFATSYIPTTISTVTRAADSATISSISAVGWSSDASTLFVETRFTGRPTGSTNNLFTLSGTVAALFAYNNNFDVSDVRIFNGTQQTTASGASMVVAARKSAVGFGDGQIFGCGGNGVVNTAAYSGQFSNPTSFVISQSGTWSGWITTLRYYPRRLSNAQLQALTA